MTMADELVREQFCDEVGCVRCDRIELLGCTSGESSSLSEMVITAVGDGVS